MSRTATPDVMIHQARTLATHAYNPPDVARPTWLALMEALGVDEAAADQLAHRCPICAGEGCPRCRGTGRWVA